MKDKKKLIEGLAVFQRKKFLDHRGSLCEIHLEKIKKTLKYCVLSKSKKNVLRGFHFQKKKTYSSTCYLYRGINFRCCC